MKNFFSLLFLLSFNFSAYSLQTNPAILLADYEDVVIATDLEPDDILALKILFQEANQLYNKYPEKKYPIQLIDDFWRFCV